MKKILIIVLLFVGCASQNHVKWHIELEAMDHGQWVVAHQDARVYVSAGSYGGMSACRHHVLLQQYVLSEQGAEEFRFSVGPVVDGDYYPIRRFRSYQEAMQFLSELSPMQAVAYIRKYKGMGK